MRRPAIILLFLAGTASGLSAAPGRGETTERVSYSDAESPPSRAGPGWIELASATPARHGREFVMVAPDAATFSQLRITAAKGSLWLQAVQIEYRDGTRRMVAIDKALGPRRRSVYVELEADRPVRQIIVITDRTSPGSYVVEGHASEAGMASP